MTMTKIDEMLSKLRPDDAVYLRDFLEFLRLWKQFRASTGPERESLSIKLQENLDRKSGDSK